jgi:NAD(P)-dependent dehydrogenase (short-subunit alcohol dehydrogenase family)
METRRKYGRNSEKTVINVKDKVVFITGVGGGIGREHVLEFGRRGAKVVVNDLGFECPRRRHQHLVATFAAEIVAHGGNAVSNNFSVADPDKAKAMVQQAINEFGRIDIVINIAGILRNQTSKNTTTMPSNSLSKSIC